MTDYQPLYTAPVAAPALDLVADQGFTIFPLAPDLPVPTYYWGGKGEIAEWMICPKCCGKFPISKETVAQLNAAQPAPVAAPDDAIDWEGIAADQAMTIAMLKVDYQQLQALVTSQGIRLMEQEEWQKDAAKYQWLLRLFVYLGDSPAETLDAAIVKTMAKMPLEKS